MIISIIAAMSDNRVIGAHGKLPWDIPADLARFRSLTMGHAVLMGRKTFESIGHPLDGRKNIVLSKSMGRTEGVIVARTLQEGIAAAEGDEELFICGGEGVFREALPLCQRIYLTVVHGRYEGDVHFPQPPCSFIELHREEFLEGFPPTTYLVMEKVDQIQPGSDVFELRQKGVEALNRQLYFLARCCFGQAQALEDAPETASDLAFSQAKSGGDCHEALKLAEQALRAAPDNLRVRLNLGRILILTGEKGKGLETLRKGVQMGGGQEFYTELAKCGTRGTPPIKSLPRSHPLNRYLGILMHRLNMRG
ncbi:dihydrofolate reductase [Geomonas sp. Red69]|uniref:dihydrofolate reductase n=1 Tax=Geomonas diazotrophica TaxID=2843197 RepID=A0ABX8JMP2_9BACT|nr:MULTISPECIES: dihydrofolate reductase [Geomonas]MBU5636936.1 dihydrofolate reductase [Geomonas diazotrophica]QWV98837.1 dihydrofolate reductase [Geomonas nitrogeniifigens]QXE87984.1 dihydrofolate reductase [Geomonas nitrogeniifigens]